VVTGQGKTAPIRVHANHTVTSDRTEVLQKLKTRESYSTVSIKQKTVKSFNQKMKQNFITNKKFRKILTMLQYIQEVGNVHS
jgi:hypothetical protein